MMMAQSGPEQFLVRSTGCSSSGLSPVVPEAGRYQNVRLVACDAVSGAAVFHANDSKTSGRVAIRRLRFDSSAIQQQQLHEARRLCQLNHQNICILQCLIRSPCQTSDRSHHVYVIEELLDTDLSVVIQSGQLTSGHCKLFTYQLLRGLSYIHSANICHRNLRPSSVCINCDSLVLKIGDFAVGCRVNHADVDLDSYWYQSPELIISAAADSGKACDIWSAGCIVAEMATGQPLFRGDSQMDQLLRLIDSVHLSEDDWRRVLHVMPNKMLKNHPFRPRSPLRIRLAGLDQNIVQLLDSLLTFNPEQRITAEQTLGFAYLQEYHSPDDEPSTAATPPFRLTDDDKDDDADDAALCLFLSSLDVTSSPSSLSSSSTVDVSPQQTPCQRPHPQKAKQNTAAGGICSSNPGKFTRDSYDSEAVCSSNVDRSDVARKNMRNNRERIGDDRTPSPNIIDLLNRSFESESGGSGMSSGIKGPSGKLHEADSESEKEMAELSEEKLREDLEVGNITTEALQQQQLREKEMVPIVLPPVETIHRPDSLRVTSSGPINSLCLGDHRKGDLSVGDLSVGDLSVGGRSKAASCSSFMTQHGQSNYLDLACDLSNDADLYARNFAVVQNDYNNLGYSRHNDKNRCSSPKDHISPRQPFVLVSFPEDSNKRNVSDEDNDSKKKKVPTATLR